MLTGAPGADLVDDQRVKAYAAAFRISEAVNLLHSYVTQKPKGKGGSKLRGR